MIERIYRGQGGAKRETPADVPSSRFVEETHPGGYLADDDLRDAANTALILQQPLLLTGEPGTGKTQFARSLAWDLGMNQCLPFITKSTSRAQDLFYIYDALGRFHASRIDGDVDVRNYLAYQALGAAILQTQPREAVQEVIPADWEHRGPVRSVVLIDEVDKAPRDFPNDILSELEKMEFHIPELNGARIGSDPAHRPILVITSNSEKNLPEAFLRRCIYYDIEFPDREKLIGIVKARLGWLLKPVPDEFLSDALDLFDTLRADGAELHKKPATAELLAWLRLLLQHSKPGENVLQQDSTVIRRTLSVMVKTRSDRKSAEEAVKRRRR